MGAGAGEAGAGAGKVRVGEEMGGEAMEWERVGEEAMEQAIRRNLKSKKREIQGVPLRIKTTTKTKMPTIK